MTITWKTEKRKLADLIPSNYNPRKLSETQKKHLKKSIEKFGYVETIDINTDNAVIGGHQRLKVMADIGGYDEIDVRVPNRKLTEKEEKELNLRLNKNIGEFDYDLLGVGEFELDMLTDVGFDDGELSLIFPEKEMIEDDVPEINEVEPIAKLGDIWQLGRHRLMCGDCTVNENAALLMDGKKADMVFTDPPFDIENQNYHVSINDMCCNSHIFVMHDDRGIVEYLSKSSLFFNRFFVADLKFRCPRGNDPYLKHILVSHEKKGNPMKHKNRHDGFDSIIKMDYRGNLKEDETIHKHQKSIKFISKFIQHYSLEKMLIADIFLGSGSTLIACEQTDRICYGMEIEPKYCDVIIARWEKLTGNKATLCVN